MRSIATWPVLITVCGILSICACGSGTQTSDGPAGAPTCVYSAYEGASCNLAVSTDGCGAVWREGCTSGDSQASGCVTMGNVERTEHPGATCPELGYTIQCNDEWVNQAYIDSWPLGFTQACPATGGNPTPSTPDKCGSCDTFGSYGRCCGGSYCAGECIGSSCC
jgi:hypothetical protein